MITATLSNEQLQRYVPSAFATERWSGTSNRYTFVPTSSVIEGMRAAGFFPVRASQSRTRIPGKQEFTKHMITFRDLRSVNQLAVVGEHVLEVNLINSHDGTSRYLLVGGVFRFTCSNGAKVSDGTLASIRVKHMGDIIGQVVDGTALLLEQGPRVMDTIDRWKTIELAPVEQRLLAEGAHSLRFPVDADGKAHTEVTPDMLLAVRRSDDRKPDLWTTFNRVQENTLRGVKTWARTGKVSSRAVKGIDGDVRLNRALWTLAEKMAELKGGASVA